MKGKYDKETFDESKKNSESYLTGREINATKNDENFVFSHEVTNRITYSNEDNTTETGKEINDNHSEAEDLHKHIDNKNVEKITKATTNTSSALSTTAAVATTAVVAVVGGGLALGQIVDKLVCRFNRLVAVENSIEYSLALAKNEIRIDSGEDNGECSVVVILTCESIEDFEERKEISNMGVIEGSFNDLKYDTEYTIDVIQTAILSMADAHLLEEPLKIRTAPGANPEPEPVNAINVTRSLDPLGNYDLYAQIEYYDSLEQYAGNEFYIGLYQPRPDGAQGSDFPGGMEFLTYQTVQSPYDQEFKLNPEFYQRLEEMESVAESTGEAQDVRLAFYTNVEEQVTPEEGSEPYTVEVPKILVERTLSISDIPVYQQEYSDGAYVENVYISPDGIYQTNIFVQLSVTEGRSNFKTYFFDMGEVPDNDPIINPNPAPITRDPHYDGATQIGHIYRTINETATLDLDDEQFTYIVYGHLYRVTVTCDSTRPEDVEKWHAEGNGSGTEEEAYDVTVLETDLKYEDIRIREVRTDEPVLGYMSTHFYRSYHDRVGAYIEFTLDDPHNVLSDWKAVMINSNDETIRYESAMVLDAIYGSYDITKYFNLADIPDDTLREMMNVQEDYTIEVYARSTWSGHDDNEKDDEGRAKVKTFEGNKPYQPEYYPICSQISFARTPTGGEGNYQVAVHTDNTYRYQELTVVIDGIDSGDTTHLEIEIPEFDTQYSIPGMDTILREDHYYQVTIKGKDTYHDSSVISDLFTETINFYTV